METALLLGLLNACGWALLFLARNDWPRKVLWGILKSLERFSPGRRIYQKFLEIEHRLEALADHMALMALRTDLIGSNVHSAVCTTDSDGHLTWASEDFLRLAGQPLEGVTDENWISTIYQEDRGHVLSAWRAAVESRSNFSYDFRYAAQGRSGVVWVSAFAKYARNPISGKVAGWVCEVKRRPPPTMENECPAGHFVPPM